MREDHRAAIEDFLAQDRIAVAGVSRDGKAVGNAIAERLRGAGKSVFAVNPAAESIGGLSCHASIAAIPGSVDGVVITTPPTITPSVMRDCAECGVKRVWIHRSFGRGSYSEEAVALGRERGIQVIPGGCPMMHCPPVDVAHRCMHWVLRVLGKLPEGA